MRPSVAHRCMSPVPAWLRMPEFCIRRPVFNSNQADGRSGMRWHHSAEALAGVRHASGAGQAPGVQDGGSADDAVLLFEEKLQSLRKFGTELLPGENAEPSTEGGIGHGANHFEPEVDQVRAAPIAKHAE